MEISVKVSTCKWMLYNSKGSVYNCNYMTRFGMVSEMASEMASEMVSKIG